MVADWMGASRAYEGHYPDAKDWGWWLKNREKLRARMHPESFAEVLSILMRVLHTSATELMEEAA